MFLCFNMQLAKHVTVYALKETFQPLPHHLYESPVHSHISCQMNPFQETNKSTTNELMVENIWLAKKVDKNSAEQL